MTLGWHNVWRFRVLAMQLPTNSAWTTHRIYLGAVYLAAQLSVPTESDCEWHARRHGQQYAYAEPSEHSKAPRGYSTTQRRGRRPKVETERQLQEAMDS